ncbi:MAG: hypothetical protein WAT70_14165 [Rhizobiaceae bacterium]
MKTGDTGAPDAFDRRLLDIVAGRGSMVLAGNKEYFAVLHWRAGRWMIEDGDTMLPAEVSVHEVSETAAASRIRSRIHELNARYRPEEWVAVTGEQLVAELCDIHV